MTAHTVPHSVGLNRPARPLPPLACDSHMHIFDPRFAPSPHWKRTPPDAPVAAYRRLQQRLGTQRTVVVTPSTYGTDNACTLDALDQLGDGARGVAVVAQDVGDAELDRLYRGAVRQFGRDARADTLRAAQRAWLAWDAAETRSDLAQQADGGSIGPVTVSNLAMQRRRARACTLFNMQDEP